MSARIRIGTRASPLARAQADEVGRRLVAADPALGTDGAITVEVIHTTGDRMLQGPLSAIGGKELFTREIEEALKEGRIDIAVHSMKDMPTRLPDGLVIGAVLPRADPRDALIAADAEAGSRGLAGLADGAVMGTASLRRGALARHARPDLKVVAFRGNVQTRLRKLEDGEADATLLALAGLDRLGLAHRAHAVLDPGVMLPAVCQGIIGIECRTGDTAVRERLRSVDDADSADAAAAERALLAGLDGSCRTPIAALALPERESLSLRAVLVRPDGNDLLEAERRGGRADAAAMGSDAARELRARATPAHFAGA